MEFRNGSATVNFMNHASYLPPETALCKFNIKSPDTLRAITEGVFPFSNSAQIADKIALSCDASPPR